MKPGCWLVLVLLFCPIVRSQQTENVPILADVRNVILSKPLAVTREVASASKAFARFRDPQWSALTIAQIGAASADAATSLNNFQRCPACLETGFSKYFVGEHPDAHKYVLAGAMEIGAEAVLAHYFRNRGPKNKWYWKALWSLPQSFSLCAHARAAEHNTALLADHLPAKSPH